MTFNRGELWRLNRFYSDMIHKYVYIFNIMTHSSTEELVTNYHHKFLFEFNKVYKTFSPTKKD